MWAWIVFSTLVACSSGQKMARGAADFGIKTDNGTITIEPNWVNPGSCKSAPSVVVLAAGKVTHATSPNYFEGNYADNLTCYWNFQASGEDTRLRVICNEIYLKKGDFLIINDEMYDELDGDQLDVTLETKSLWIGIKTNDDGDQAKGFSCLVKNELTCECGRAKPRRRIVGGQEAGEFDYPWHVGLVPKNFFRPFCGGSIINSDYVLTAKQCVRRYNAEEMDIILGEFDITDGEKTAVPVLNIVEHPFVDVALIQIDTLDFDILPEHIRPVCLPTSSRPKYNFRRATVMGWGANPWDDSSLAPTLRTVNLRIISNRLCQRGFGSSITEDMICAYTFKRDSCQGDTGGGLTVPVNRKIMEVVGVMSWGIGCAFLYFSPEVYIRVTEILDFILAETTGARFCDRP